MFKQNSSKLSICIQPTLVQTGQQAALRGPSTAQQERFGRFLSLLQRSQPTDRWQLLVAHDARRTKALQSTAATCRNISGHFLIIYAFFTFLSYRGWSSRDKLCESVPNKQPANSGTTLPKAVSTSRNCFNANCMSSNCAIVKMSPSRRKSSASIWHAKRAANSRRGN